MERVFATGQIVALLVVLSLAIPSAGATRQERLAKCEAAKQQIQDLRSRMRQGYSAGQGIRMDERMRKLKKRRSKYCD